MRERERERMREIEEITNEREREREKERGEHISEIKTMVKRCSYGRGRHNILQLFHTVD